MAFNCRQKTKLLRPKRLSTSGDGVVKTAVYEDEQKTVASGGQWGRRVEIALLPRAIIISRVRGVLTWQ